MAAPDGAWAICAIRGAGPYAPESNGVGLVLEVSGALEAMDTNWH